MTKLYLFLVAILDNLLSIYRVCRNYRIKPTYKPRRRNEKCIVLGNGPSAKQFIAEHICEFDKYDLLAVNFMGLTPEYTLCKPCYYVLCDPAFWFVTQNEETRNKVKSLYKRIVEETDWHLDLYIPTFARKIAEIRNTLEHNPNIHVNYFNMVECKCFKPIQYYILNKQFGMIRVQNVLIGALLLSIYFGYDKIFLAGAESDWSKNMYVDGNNCLRIVDTHFYGTKDAPFGNGIDMSTICIYLHYMFDGYRRVKEYAIYKKVKIYNLTLTSFIDSFEKTKSLI